MNEFERVRRNILINQGGVASYLIKTDNTRIDFELINTPITNFSTGASILINGASVLKEDIKEVVFGNSYSEVIALPSFFLNNCPNLQAVNVTGLSECVDIGSDAFANSTSLTEIDLSHFKWIENIGSSFMTRCLGLTQISIGSVDFSLVTAHNNGFRFISNTGDRVITADSIALGTAFKSKFPNISNWTIVQN